MRIVLVVDILLWGGIHIGHDGHLLVGKESERIDCKLYPVCVDSTCSQI